MGSSCPVCGRFWRARGCAPGDCKGTPEPVPLMSPAVFTRDDVEEMAAVASEITGATIIESRPEIGEPINTLPVGQPTLGEIDPRFVEAIRRRLETGSPLPADAGTPIQELLRAGEHPPPWGVVTDGRGNQACLVDANGDQVIGPDNMSGIFFASPRVRALTELAPNLERLREIQWRGGGVGDISGCPACDVEPFYEPDPNNPKHMPDCWIGNTIAALDAAAKVG